MWFYTFASRGTDLISRVIADRRVVGRENVPLEGPVILISNHLSLIDPPLLGAVVPRTIHFMAKEELFHKPFVSWIVRNYDSFPVRRGEADRHALQTTLKYLRQGEVVGIFPEGTRSKDRRLHPGHPGAALIALRSGAQVLPVGVSGTEQIFHWPRQALRPRVQVAIGRPFRLESADRSPKGEVLEEHTRRMMLAIAELLPEGYRGAYATTGAASASLR